MRFSTFLFLSVTIFSVSCAKARFKKASDTSVAQAVMNCSVRTLENGDAEISCPDGTTAVVRQGQDGADGSNGVDGTNGIDGVNGTNGTNGADGVSCSVVEEINGQGAVITCGSNAVLIKHGVNGSNGADGQDGEDGADGADGEDGQDGQDAPISAYQMVQLIDPCGSQSQFDEVLVRFANGDIMAHYASGANQFFTLLRSGYNYVTTDGTSCQFSLDSEGTVRDSRGNSWTKP